jgi:FkbM family methyltransferase
MERVRGLAKVATGFGSIAPSTMGTLLAWATVVGIPIKQRLPRMQDVGLPLRISLSGHTHRIAIRDRGELIAAQQVLIEREYALDLLVEPRTILDLGSHIGLSVLWFASVYPGARIIAVEPDPRNFAQLERHVGDVPNIELVHAAVAAHPGEARLSRARFSWESKVDKDGDILVTTVTVDDLLRGASAPVLLKIDIEGAEWDVLRSTDRRRFSAIVGELHKDLIPASHADFLNLLDGFRVLKDGGDDVHSVLCAIA